MSRRIYTRVIRNASELDVEMCGVDEIVLCLGSVKSATIPRWSTLTIVGDLTGEVHVGRDGGVFVYGTVTGTLRLESGSVSAIQGEIPGRVENAGLLMLDGSISGELETSVGGQVVTPDELIPDRQALIFGDKRPYLHEL